MKVSKFTVLLTTMILFISSVFPIATYAAETPELEIIPVETVENTYPERPADAKVVEIIDILVDEDGNMEVSQTPSISPYSYYDPAAITLSASGDWYFGKYRSFDGNYLGWEVTAKYANGSTSSTEGLYICLSSEVPAGDVNRKIYSIPLDGKTHKPEDWRKKFGSSDNFRFKYYNATHGTSKAGTIWIKVKVYSWN